MLEYRNDDGTYTSPKNGKIYKNERSFRSHLAYKDTDRPSNWISINKEKSSCKFCKEEVSRPNIGRHEDSCYLNPINLILCVACSNPVKDYKNSKGTCSHSCSNKHFRKLRNKPERYTQYTTICWEYHEKKCVVCPENKIVSVHHYNERHEDDRPENLVPLCPTHHQYIHSRYRDEVIDIVDKYVVEFIKDRGLA